MTESFYDRYQPVYDNLLCRHVLIMAKKQRACMTDKFITGRSDVSGLLHVISFTGSAYTSKSCFDISFVIDLVIQVKCHL